MHCMVVVKTSVKRCFASKLEKVDHCIIIQPAKSVDDATTREKHKVTKFDDSSLWSLTNFQTKGLCLKSKRRRSDQWAVVILYLS